MLKRGALLFLLTFSCLFSIGQEEGRLLWHIAPDSAIIRLDGALLSSHQGEQTLAPGEYRFQAWSPYRELIDSIITIKANSSVRIIMTLPFTTAYKEHQKDLSRYKGKKALNKIIDLSPYVLIGSYLAFDRGFYYAGLSDAAKRNDELLEQYNSVPESAWQQRERLQQEYNRHLDETEPTFENRWTTDLAVLGSAVALYFLSKTESNELRPSYDEEPLLSRLRLTPVAGAEHYGLSLSIEL